MSVLDAVMRYKQLEQNENILDQKTMASLIDTMSKSKEASDLLEFEKDKVQATLGAQGLRFDFETGRAERAPELGTPLEQFQGSVLEDIEAGRDVSPERRRAFKQTSRGRRTTIGERKLANEIEILKENNTDIETINSVIKAAGYEQEDFAVELEGYEPKIPEAKRKWPWEK